jgi:hypothetical protein
VDEVYDYFRGTRFADEEVFVDIPTAGTDRSVERARIMEKLPNTVPITLEKRLNDKRQIQRDLREAKEAGTSKVPEDPHHYRIKLLNKNQATYIVAPGQMRRGRQTLSKMTFKKYIKEVATRERNISYWQVKVC